MLHVQLSIVLVTCAHFCLFFAFWCQGLNLHAAQALHHSTYILSGSYSNKAKQQWVSVRKIRVRNLEPTTGRFTCGVLSVGSRICSDEELCGPGFRAFSGCDSFGPSCCAASYGRDFLCLPSSPLRLSSNASEYGCAG